jgi:hypothetical protein
MLDLSIFLGSLLPVSVFPSAPAVEAFSVVQLARAPAVEAFSVVQLARAEVAQEPVFPFLGLGF